MKNDREVVNKKCEKECLKKKVKEKKSTKGMAALIRENQSQPSNYTQQREKERSNVVNKKGK